MPHQAVPNNNIDTGLASIFLLARFYGLPADHKQLKHEIGNSDEIFNSDQIIRSAKLLGLKAKSVTTNWDRLPKLTLPIIGRHKDGGF